MCMNCREFWDQSSVTIFLVGMAFLKEIWCTVCWSLLPGPSKQACFIPIPEGRCVLLFLLSFWESAHPSAAETAKSSGYNCCIRAPWGACWGIKVCWWDVIRPSARGVLIWQNKCSEFLFADRGLRARCLPSSARRSPVGQLAVPAALQQQVASRLSAREGAQLWDFLGMVPGNNIFSHQLWQI